MVFAFLPTTVMYLSSIMLAIVCLTMQITGWFPEPFLMFVLLIVAVGAAILSWLLASRLYIHTVRKLTVAGFEQWVRRQQKISRRCHGKFRLSVQLNMVFAAIVYEKTDLAIRLMTDLKPRIEKTNHAYYNFVYLADTVGLKQKLHDNSDCQEIFAAMYQNLSSPAFPGGTTYERMASGLEYQRLELEFYRRSPQQLSTIDRGLTQQFNLNARIYLKYAMAQSIPDTYDILSACYNIGLSYFLLGNTQQAANYFQQLAAAPEDYPFLQRIRQFLQMPLSQRDFSLLMQTAP